MLINSNAAKQLLIGNYVKVERRFLQDDFDY